jgi:NADH-quinone oxidoreductase subunit M
MLYMAGNVLFGPLKEHHGQDTSTGLSTDLNRREVAILAPIAAVCLWLGVFPKPVIHLVEPSLKNSVLARVFEMDSTGSFAKHDEPQNAMDELRIANSQIPLISVEAAR